MHADRMLDPPANGLVSTKLFRISSRDTEDNIVEGVEIAGIPGIA